MRLVTLPDPDEALGVNDRTELAQVHRLLIGRHLVALMKAGVTLLEPERTSIEPGVRIGEDTMIHPGVSLLGKTSIGRDCVIHQGAWLRDTTVADGTTIEPYSVLEAPRWEKAAAWARSPGCGRPPLAARERGWATSSR